LNKTKFGMKIKACGEAPQAAASLGMKVEKIQFIAVLIAGTISGLAGAFFAQTQAYFRGSTQGVGFLAVAIVIFGQ
jgi:simple sugar transport system permease protein